MSYPPNELTAKITPGLVTAKPKPIFSWEGPLQPTKPLAYDADYLADTERLFIPNMSALVVVFMVIAGIGYVFAGVAGIVLYSSPHGDDAPEFVQIIWYIFYCLLALGIIFTIITYFFGTASYYIFDRLTGNVHIPRGWFKKSFTLPFEQVECYGAPFTSQYMIKNYRTMLITKLKRKWSLNLYRELPLSSGLTRESAESHWSVICQFMNRQEPLPMVGITGEWIGFFKRNNAVLADLATGKIPDEAVDAFEARIEKMQERLERHSS